MQRTGAANSAIQKRNRGADAGRGARGFAGAGGGRTMKVSFILGAGFSFNAGLPMAKDIWVKLNQENLKDQLLHYDSGEWRWRELTSGAQLSNGSYSSSIIPIAMLMENALANFKGEIDPERHNYEEFYQWLVDLHYSNETWQGVEQLT